MNFNVREAAPGDHSELMRLYEEFVEQPGRYSPGGEDSFRSVLADPNAKVLVAEVQQALVAFVAFCRRNVVRYPRPICEIEELYVQPAFRNQGLARALINAVGTSELAHNAYYIFVASDSKRTPAHEFYRTLGYTDYGIHFRKKI